MTAWTLVAHIFGLVLWLGGLLAATDILAQHTEEASPDVRRVLERLEMRFLRGMGGLGAVLALITGIILITTNPRYYLHAGWLYTKLVLVIILVALHWVVLRQTRSFAGGRIALKRRDCLLLYGTIVLVFLCILIFTLPGEVYLT